MQLARPSIGDLAMKRISPMIRIIRDLCLLALALQPLSAAAQTVPYTLGVYNDAAGHPFDLSALSAKGVTSGQIIYLNGTSLSGVASTGSGSVVLASGTTGAGSAAFGAGDCAICCGFAATTPDPSISPVCSLAVSVS